MRLMGHAIPGPTWGPPVLVQLVLLSWKWWGRREIPVYYRPEHVIGVVFAQDETSCVLIDWVVAVDVPGHWCTE